MPQENLPGSATSPTSTCGSKLKFFHGHDYTIEVQPSLHTKKIS